MSQQRHRGPLTWRLHPIWRGIGLILLILIPVISFGLAEIFLDYFVAQSPDLPQSPEQIIIGVDNLYLQIGVTLVLTIILYLLLSIIGSVVYSVMGGREHEEIVSRLGSGRRKY